jgi:hypothetical protein
MARAPEDRSSDIDYQRLWAGREGVNHFGDRLIDAWSRTYLGAVDRGDDLVLVDPGNGFAYLFDRTGALRPVPAAHAPRVIGVWGLSRPVAGGRDPVRMRGHPRPSRGEDDRGHLISCAAGGGHDINLVPMDAALNRGWSVDGARFRDIERRAAAVPGTLFFIRPVYGDQTDRPVRFEVGVEASGRLIVEAFPNPAGVAPPSVSAFRRAAALPIEEELVKSCLDLGQLLDRLFDRAWRSGPALLSRNERCAVAGVTGHVAESVVELLLDALGWRVLWHFVGPGRHGVDLLFLTPDDHVVAIETKGTLVRGSLPRLSRRALAQMSAAWLDHADNPGMTNLGLTSADILGGIVAVDFPALTWRALLTTDFVEMRPVISADELRNLAWLTMEGADAGQLDPNVVHKGSSG